MGCLEDAKKAYGDAFNEAEIESAFQKLSESKENAIQSQADILEELNKSGLETVRDREFNLKAQKIQQAHKLEAIYSNLERIMKLKDRNNPIMEGLYSKLTGLFRGQYDMRNSTFLKQVVATNKMDHDLLEGFGKDGLPIWNSKENELEITKSILNAKKGIKSENPIFDKIGRTVNKAYEDTEKKLAEQGIYYDKLDDRIMKNVHVPDRLMSPTGGIVGDRKFKFSVNNDPVKVKEAAFQRWKNMLLQKGTLQDRTFEDFNIKTDSEKESFLRESFDSLTNKGLTLDRPVSFAQKFAQPRILHFTPEGLVKYNTEYGSGSIQDGIYNELHHLNRSIEVIKDWGLNPKNTLDNVLKISSENKELKNKLPKPSQVKKMSRLMDGLTNKPTDQPYSLGTLTSNLRAYQDMTKLWKVVLRSVPDMGLLAHEMARVGERPMRAWGTAIKLLTQGASNEDLKKMLDLYGVYKSHMVGGFVRFTDPNMSVTGVMAKGQRLAFKLNGLSRWDYALRGATALSHGRHLAMNKDISFEKLSDADKNLLGQYGLDKGEWDVIRQSQIREADGKNYIVPQGVQDVPRRTLEDYLRNQGVKKITNFRIQKARDELEQKLSSYFQDRVDHVIMRPDLIDKDILSFGQTKDSAMHWLTQLTSQYKGFQMAYTRRILGQSVIGKGGESYWNSLLSGKADYRALMRISAYMMGFSYIGATLTNLVQGKSPPSLTDPHTWFKIMLEPLGFWASILELDPKSPIGSAAEFLLGPTFSDASKLATLPLGEADKIVGQHNHISRVRSRNQHSTALGMTRFVEHSIPLINQMYTNWALNNFLFYEIEDMIDPGARRRRLQQLKRENVSQIF